MGVQDALEALPNFAIPSVEVDFSGLDFAVTFVDPTNTGQQSLLGFTVNNDCESGQQPKLGSNNDYSCNVTRNLLNAPTVEHVIVIPVYARVFQATMVLHVTKL